MRLREREREREDISEQRSERIKLESMSCVCVYGMTFGHLCWRWWWHPLQCIYLTHMCGTHLDDVLATCQIELNTATHSGTHNALGIWSIHARAREWDWSRFPREILSLSPHIHTDKCWTGIPNGELLRMQSLNDWMLKRERERERIVQWFIMTVHVFFAVFLTVREDGY